MATDKIPVSKLSPYFVGFFFHTGTAASGCWLRAREHFFFQNGGYPKMLIFALILSFTMAKFTLQNERFTLAIFSKFKNR